MENIKYCSVRLPEIIFREIQKNAQNRKYNTTDYIILALLAQFEKDKMFNTENVPKT